MLGARVRAGLVITAVISVGIAVLVDPVVHRGRLAELLAIKAPVWLAVLGVWRLSRTATRRGLIWGTVVFTIGLAAAISASSALVGEAWSAHVLCLLTVVTCAALLPWGVRAQIVAAPIMMALATVPTFAYGTPVEARFAASIALFTVVGSIIIAREQDRYRGWAWKTLELSRENTERLRQIADHINAVLWLGELHERGETFLYVSPRYDDVWGSDRRALGDRPRAWLDAVHPADRRQVEASFRDGALRGDWSREYRLLRPSGEVRWVRDAVFAIADPDGRTRRIARLSQDTTAEREAAGARRMRELARGVQATREEERRRVARELHDELGQALTGIKLTLAGLALAGSDASPAAAPVRACIDEIDGAMTSVHHMIHRLHSPVLDGLDLTAALRAHVDAFSARTGIVCALDAPAREPALSKEESTAVFRIAQESLTNVARHARARRVHVRLADEADVLRLTVTDDGCGAGGAPPGFGVRGMSERAALLGGTLAVEPGPGGGTVVSLELPRLRMRRRA